MKEELAWRRTAMSTSIKDIQEGRQAVVEKVALEQKIFKQTTEYSAVLRQSATEHKVLRELVRELQEGACCMQECMLMAQEEVHSWRWQAGSAVSMWEKYALAKQHARQRQKTGRAPVTIRTTTYAPAAGGSVPVFVRRHENIGNGVPVDDRNAHRDGAMTAAVVVSRGAFLRVTEPKATMIGRRQLPNPSEGSTSSVNGSTVLPKILTMT
jgi:hypothetical protein